VVPDKSVEYIDFGKKDCRPDTSLHQVCPSGAVYILPIIFVSYQAFLPSRGLDNFPIVHSYLPFDSHQIGRSTPHSPRITLDYETNGAQLALRNDQQGRLRLDSPFPGTDFSPICPPSFSPMITDNLCRTSCSAVKMFKKYRSHMSCKQCLHRLNHTHHQKLSIASLQDCFAGLNAITSSKPFKTSGFRPNDSGEESAAQRGSYHLGS
jgi:hypothetical protein